MKRMQPTAWFWIIAAAILAVALFTVGNAHGQQSAGAAATFEGRPAMGGAQAGTGAMAGPPQGGLSTQSPGDPGAGIGTNRQRDDAAGPLIPRDPGRGRLPGDGDLSPQRDRGGDVMPKREGEVIPKREGDVIKRDRDDHGLQQQSESRSKAKRAGKRSIERARRGVSGVDS